VRGIFFPKRKIKIAHWHILAGDFNCREWLYIPTANSRIACESTWRNSWAFGFAHSPQQSE
jgi:hypothetical protein